MNKVFLGGTFGKTSWRDELIKLLKIDYFNPIVEDWTSDCIKEEDRQKADLCNIHLYVITSEMSGVYSIAEAVQSSRTEGKFTIFHVIPKGFSKSQLKSLQAVCDMIKSNGGVAYLQCGLNVTVNLLNKENNDNNWLLQEVRRAYDLYCSGKAEFVSHDDAMKALDDKMKEVKATSAAYSRLKSEIAELKERNYKLAEMLDNSRPVYIEKRQWALMITQLEKAQSLEQTLRLRIMLMEGCE